MYHVRKRALLACDFCRHRKRRCDGNKPCGTCRESSADCNYQELPLVPFERAEQEAGASSAVLDRLNRIETLLEQQSQQLHQLDARSSQSPYPSSLSEQNEYTRYVPADSSLESSQFLIPKNHAGQVFSLLALPAIRNVVGDIPRDYFHLVENSLPLPPALENFHDGHLVMPDLDAQKLDTLAAQYFSSVHPHQPLFTASALGAWQCELLEKRDPGSIRTSICLCVYALGSLCTSPSDDSENHETLGIEYFEPAFKIMIRETVWGHFPNIEVCQALLLAALYFAYLGRPLHGFRMAYNASRKFLFLADSRQQCIDQEGFNNDERLVFWHCFRIESDGIAVFNHYHSGIEPLSDRIPLPQSLDSADNENHVYSIAEHAIRRQLNRIHSIFYDYDDAHRYPQLLADPACVWQRLGLQKLLSLSVELNRQLEEWRRSIPEHLRFTKGSLPLPNDRSLVLRMRYYTAQIQIHRPFLLQTLSHQADYWSPSQKSVAMDPDPISLTMPMMLERSETCIEACVNALYNAAEIMDKRSPYLWQLSVISLSSLIMLWLAENSTALAQASVPPMRPIQAMILSRLRHWAIKQSSLHAQIQIVEQLVFSDRA